MEALDTFVNKFISPASVPAGVGTVFLTFFSSKIAPQMPQRFYKLLDNLAIRVIIVAFLINQQIKSPSKAILISLAGVIGLHTFVKVAAPEAPSLSELVHPTEDKKSEKDKNCNCHFTINLQQAPGMSTFPATLESKSPHDVRVLDTSAPTNATANTNDVSMW